MEDLDAVVEAQGLKKFPLFGMSQGGALAIAYAARHPDRVSHLILFGAYGKGVLRRNITEQEREEAETLVKLIRLGWGRDNPAFRQVIQVILQVPSIRRHGVGGGTSLGGQVVKVFREISLRFADRFASHECAVYRNKLVRFSYPTVVDGP